MGLSPKGFGVVRDQYSSTSFKNSAMEKPKPVTDDRHRGPVQTSRAGKTVKKDPKVPIRDLCHSPCEGLG